MLDAIFTFTDFEAFHGAELDTDIVLEHRQQSRKMDQRAPLQSSTKAEQIKLKAVETTQESGKAYQQVSLSGRKDQTSSSSTVRKAEAGQYASVKAKVNGNGSEKGHLMIIRTEDSPVKMGVRMGPSTSKAVLDDPTRIVV